MADSIKINKLEIENVKRIKAVKIEPTKNGLTIVGGNNNQGRMLFSLNGRTASRKPCWCCQRDAEKQLSLQRLQKNVLREEAAS